MSEVCLSLGDLVFEQDNRVSVRIVEYAGNRFSIHDRGEFIPPKMNIHRREFRRATFQQIQALIGAKGREIQVILSDIWYER